MGSLPPALLKPRGQAAPPHRAPYTRHTPHRQWEASVIKQRASLRRVQQAIVNPRVLPRPLPFQGGRSLPLLPSDAQPTLCHPPLCGPSCDTPSSLPPPSLARSPPRSLAAGRLLQRAAAGLAGRPARTSTPGQSLLPRPQGKAAWCKGAGVGGVGGGAHPAVLARPRALAGIPSDSRPCKYVCAH